MKRILVIVLTIALIFIVVGIAMMAFGGESVSSVVDDVKKEGFLGYIFNKNENTSGEKTNIVDIEGINFETIEKEFDKIDSIIIDSSIYSIQMVTDKNVNKYKVNIQKPIVDSKIFDINISKNGNEIKIEQLQKNKNNIFQPYEKIYKKCLVTITVPAKKEIKILDFDISIGSIEINSINADKLTVDSGVSNVVINDSKFVSAKIESGVGDIVAKDSRIGNAEFNIGVGDTQFSGDITGELKVGLGTGNAEIDLKNKQNQYNYDLHKGVGSISINNESYKKDTKINNGAKVNIKLEAGVGNIEIKTDK